jgi:hypothetical protein
VSGTGKGFILRFQSTVEGRDGIAGPYKELGVIMQPDKDSQQWEGWQGVATFNPFQLSNGHWLAFYGSAAGHHPEGWLVGLASAPALSGPWTRLPQGNPVLIESVFMENPIVTKIGDLFVMVHDSDVLNPTKRAYFFERHTVGYSTSKDGVNWSKGGRIMVQPKPVGDANWASDSAPRSVWSMKATASTRWFTPRMGRFQIGRNGEGETYPEIINVATSMIKPTWKRGGATDPLQPCGLLEAEAIQLLPASFSVIHQNHLL